MSEEATKRGKIAKLPAEIREEICRRLFDGESGRKLLPWLNADPRVIKLLEEDFEGVRVNDANLSAWRNTGYQEWLQRRARVERTRELARYAAEQTRANGASIADGAAAIAGGKLLEVLEMIDEATITIDEDGEKHLPVDALVNITSALSSLRTTEQNDLRLRQNDRRLAQKDELIALERQRFQRDTCELFLKWHADKAAQDAAAGEGANADKIERLGQLMFGDTWQAKPAPNAPAA